jgi:peptide/nickel transport system substrate-binding protein
MTVDEGKWAISRRDLLTGAAIGAGGLLIAGCGGGSRTGSTTATGGTTATATTALKRGGVFRLGTNDGSTADSIDPLQAEATLTNTARTYALYDLLVMSDDKTDEPVPWLAESLEPATDLSYWTVRLRDAEFHNGKAVTADDVIFSLQRILNPKNGASGAALIASIDPQRMQKLDARTVRLNLHYPDVGLAYGLRGTVCAIVPVGYNAKKPIGSGPFKFESFTPGQQSTFVRNENYWQSGKPYLDEFHVIDFADPNTTRINALTSGQIDAANLIPASLMSTVQGASNVEVLISEGYSYHTYEMRMDVPPFDDVRVRQAMRLIADRQQIVEQAFSGPRFATVANDWPSFQDPMYDHSIPQRAQDIEQAKSLLKQAGHEGLSVQLAVSNVAPGVVETAQVLAQQAGAAGVTIKVNNIADPATYFSKYYAQAPFKFDYFNTFSVLEHIRLSLLPTSSYNISNWRDEQWLKIYTQAQSTLDSAKRKELLAEAQKIFWDTGTQGIFNYHNTVDAHSTMFTGFRPSITGFGLNNLHFENVGLA